MYEEGTIEIPTQDEKIKVAQYWCKYYKDGSKWGIDGGRISKLMIKIDGCIVVNYDRGWDIKLNTNDEASMIAYNILLNKYN